ncbi:SDR family oxidoreductase [Mesorhizobium australicum]|uniref:NADP-dependent 3-hydroxy acid dehydrogenase YdfG n=1 Tax=Mesorhizobium australicum TaxID=536018 RepID=A0A1X7PMN2_9HYPH|nr:SDR family oxidoreductase [Mesorhizobium australicum]SMH52313.1 NADP-dependent 3-hydroxy acid dehydrogenase YdfG [Mesorhizobium australicum]
MKTVLITGCSSGFGLEIARHFLQEGWRVIATMRTPRADLLPASKNLQVVGLDVRDPDSIRSAVEAAGDIDVLVNNAGIGWLNALEGTSLDTAHDVFETNTLGTMAMMQAVLPGFRARKGGVVVNVSSSVTLKPLPLLSVYTASKAAVNAFTESVALELEPFNIRVRIVLPGRAPVTRFGENARTRMQASGGIPDAYGELARNVFAGWAGDTADLTQARDVVDAVWRAATDPNCPMRLYAGADAVALAA